MTKLPQCSETARHGSAYMGRSAKVAVDVDAQVVYTTMRALPAYMKVVILLRSSGGAHFASMAAIEGYVTAYEHARDLLESSMDPARRSDGQTEPRHSPFPVLLQHRSNVYLSFSISN